MIIDAILDRKDSLEYNSKDFYNACFGYGDVGKNILRAMEGGIESNVKEALKQYIQDNEYNPLICDYIDRVNWLRGTELTVEKAAADEFNKACRAREEAEQKMSAPVGKVEDSYDKLMDSLEKEMKAFEDSYKSMSTTQVYNDWYVIGFYSEYYDMLTNGFLADSGVADEVVAWLATKEKPLEFLYDKWMSCDGSFSHNWDDMLDWVSLLYKEEIAMQQDNIPNDKIMVATLDDDVLKAPIDSQISSAEDKKNSDKSDVNPLRNDFEI